MIRVIPHTQKHHHQIAHDHLEITWTVAKRDNIWNTRLSSICNAIERECSGKLWEKIGGQLCNSLLEYVFIVHIPRFTRHHVHT